MEAPGYFPAEEPRLRALLDEFLASLREGLKEQPFAGGVRSLLLAGGYGRGEGGIFLSEETAAPQLYNDLEFYCVLAEGIPAGPVEAWCAHQAHQGEASLGIEVEFKILRESQLKAGEPSMFYYDLLSAHRFVSGSPSFLEELPARLREGDLIPAHEAARLLFNRGSGLLFSSAALQAQDPRVANGFVERNHAKVRLALADAVLAANGRYHFSCIERQRRISEPLAQTPPLWETLVEWHAEGVEFKLHPRHQQPGLEILRARHEALTRAWMQTFLWLEALRLEASFPTALQYGTYTGRLFPHTSAARNLALHFRDRVKRGAALPGWTDYPRAALQRALVFLLMPEPELARAARCLGLSPAAGWSEIHAYYERWWKCYN